MDLTRAVNVTEQNLADVMKKLKIDEGFGVGLEMSGNATGVSGNDRFHEPRRENRDVGHSAAANGIDWNTVIFNMLTIKGIYGREMYETWYKMTVMLESGLDISPVITHRFPYGEFEQAFEAMHSGDAAKVVLDWR